MVVLLQNKNLLILTYIVFMFRFILVMKKTFISCLN